MTVKHAITLNASSEKGPYESTIVMTSPSTQILIRSSDQFNALYLNRPASYKKRHLFTHSRMLTKRA